MAEFVALALGGLVTLSFLFFCIKNFDDLDLR
jgi:hypothetical protein